jgi:sugar phosphate isomerase/epimerase
MKIQFFCPRWGSEDLPWNIFCKKVKNAGYDGVEAGIPFEETEKNSIVSALKENDLLLVGQYYQSFEKDFNEHYTNYEKYLRNIISVNPILIDAQTGKDYYTAEQNGLLFQLAQKIATDTGISIAHETHRNKALFAAHVAEQLLRQNEYVKITADFSHWCCVAETLLEDQQEALQLACSRAIHIHARVGHAQAPQVNEPRAEEWKLTVETHLQWWDAIVANRKKEGAELLTITTEFGPAPYLPALPHSMVPVANQWDINEYMLKTLKQRYSTVG